MKPYPADEEQSGKFKNELIMTNEILKEILKEITGEEVQYAQPPYGSWDKSFEKEFREGAEQVPGALDGGSPGLELQERGTDHGKNRQQNRGE